MGLLLEEGDESATKEDLLVVGEGVTLLLEERRGSATRA